MVFPVNLQANRALDPKATKANNKHLILIKLIDIMRISALFHKNNSLSPYWALCRLNKPIGILLLIWPSQAALCLSNLSDPPKLSLIITFLFGALLVRSAGCAINDFWDKDFDPHVERTAQRPLAQKQIPASHALALVVAIMMMAGLLALTLNPLSISIAVASAALTLLYPLAKRICQCPQVILAITFNAGILMAFSCIQNHIPTVAWLFYLANILLTIAYDSAYALVDLNDDQSIGVGSLATLFKSNTIYLILIADGLGFALFITIGLLLSFNLIYYGCLLIAALILAPLQYQLWRTSLTTYAFQLFTKHHWTLLFIMIGVISQHQQWMML